MQREKPLTAAAASRKSYPQSPANLINLSKYPLSRLGSPEGVRLVARCHEHLNSSGVCLLREFVRPGAVETMAAEAREAESRACFRRSSHNAYLEPDDDAFTPDHPRRYRLETSAGTIARDRLAVGSALGRLYQWNPFVSFVDAAFGNRKHLRPTELLGALSVSVLRNGDRYAWHFDEAEFSTSLLLQASESGGEFEYVPVKRFNGDLQNAIVGRIVRDEHNEVIRVPICPGDLLLISGRSIIHRVIEVRGTTSRLAANFCFRNGSKKANSAVLSGMSRARPQ